LNRSLVAAWDALRFSPDIFPPTPTSGIVIVPVDRDGSIRVWNWLCGVRSWLLSVQTPALQSKKAAPNTAIIECLNFIDVSSGRRPAHLVLQEKCRA
jgi:hypothetical protein